MFVKEFDTIPRDVMPLTFAELLEMAGKLGPVGVPRLGYQAATGEPYITIGSRFVGHDIREHIGRDAAVDSEVAAIQGFWRNLRFYVVARPGVIYWREMPEMHVMKARDRWCVECRILKSAAPVLAEMMDDAA